MKIDKLMIARVVFAVWAVLWLLFLTRPYFKKDLIGEYRTLLSRDLEGKRSYVTGDALYKVIKGKPVYSTEGLGEDPLSPCRALYYLYPAVPSGERQGEGK